MYIANQLRQKNICEYLLYMWQVEDTIRAFGCDIDRIRQDYIPGFKLSESDEQKEVEWFENLIRMMGEEGCRETGHLQINKSTLSLLADLHQQMLKSSKQPFYSAAYYRALPFIVELRSKGDTQVSEVETCLTMLYGVMMLKVQRREVSADTKQAVSVVSHLLSLLAEAYNKEKLGELEL